MSEEKGSARALTLNLSLGTCGFICFIVFLILKLTGVIDWNWFWIWFPLWLPIALEILLFVSIFVALIVIDRRGL